MTELRKRVACRYGQSAALSSSLASVTQTRPDDDDTDGQQSSRAAVKVNGVQSMQKGGKERKGC